ncbi:SnoaL-like domain containing protein [Cupriavidus gilardii CR3]|nr:SnoaL-like domain containing protein [Cupriavidus gilardii CR3]
MEYASKQAGTEAIVAADSNPSGQQAGGASGGVTAATLQAFSDAWNRHDIDALMSFMTDDCVFHAVAGGELFGRTFSGREAVREGFQLAWQTFPDAAWLDGEHFVCGDRGVSESTFRGTKADGSRIEARMVDVFTFRDGKIAVKNAYRKDRPALAAGSRG